MVKQKDKTKGDIASNYRSITCLSLVCKVLASILADDIYDYLEKICYCLRNRSDLDESVRGQVIYYLLKK